MPGSALITGAAGFIGSTLTDHLLTQGWTVTGIDNFCDFYDPQAKRRNLAQAFASDHFALIEADIRDTQAVLDAFDRHRPDVVVHVAAMAGIRPSITRPTYYTDVNLNGTASVLEAAARYEVSKFIFASSSSVYGNNTKVPFAESDPVDHPISPYAATKRAGELLCHTYWHLHSLPVSCLRFFTVYGPRQRPDLAISKFLRMAAQHKPIPFFGDGSSSRDYTFVDDVVAGILAAIDRCDRFRIYNIGGNEPVTLEELVQTIERVAGRPVEIERLPMQPGDVQRTYADLTRSQRELGYQPHTSLEEGIRRQWQWMQSLP